MSIQKLNDTTFWMLGWNGAHACVLSPLLCKEGTGEVERFASLDSTHGADAAPLYPTSPPLTKGRDTDVTVFVNHQSSQVRLCVEL